MIGSTTTYNLPKPFNIDRNYSFGIALFFILWPFGAFLFSLYHYYKRESKVIMILFTALFGYCMVAESSGLDIFRILQLVEIYSRIETSDILKMVSGIYSNDPDASSDIYVDIVATIVSRFTSNGRILTMTFGIVYSVLFVKVLSLFESGINPRNRFLVILLLCFSVVFGLDQLAGVRYATAAYLFFLATVKYELTKEKRFLVLLLTAPLIHYSYLSLILTFLIFLLLRNKGYIIYAILIISFILPDALLVYIDQASGFLGANIESKTYAYSKLMEEAARKAQQGNWYIIYRDDIMMYFMLICSLFTRLKSTKIALSKTANNIFFFSLLVLALSNFTYDIFNAGFRYRFNFIMFSVFYLYLVFIENSERKSIRAIIYTALPAFLFHFLYSYRNTLYYSPSSLYFGNIFSLFYEDFDQSLWSSLFG